MLIPLRDGKEVEIPQDWIDEWNKVYYDVPKALADARIWCLDNEAKRKTKRGLRAFLGRWIRKDCTKRPQEKVQVVEVGDGLLREQVPLEVRQAHLAKLRELVK